MSSRGFMFPYHLKSSLFQGRKSTRSELILFQGLSGCVFLGQPHQKPQPPSSLLPIYGDLELRVSPINKNKARRESLREPRHDQNVFGNACGSSANQKENALAFAEVPQIKKRTFWRLRDYRKSKKERFGACGTPANQKENALAFAGLPQIKKRTFWRLRKFRKSKKERFGICGSSANRKTTFNSLRNFRKHFQKHIGRYSPLSKPFFRD